jgi:hypothetical protein
VNAFAHEQISACARVAQTIARSVAEAFGDAWGERIGLCSARAGQACLSHTIEEPSMHASSARGIIVRGSWIVALRSRIAFACASVALEACTFGGYVPTEPAPKPLAASEATVLDLALGDSATGRLDCPDGRCQIRYRMVVPGPGSLVVTVKRPTGGGDDGGSGPRIARAVLEGVAQQPLATRRRADGPPPFVVQSAVQGGIHYVLIQALGGPTQYEVASQFTPDSQKVSEAGTDLATPDPLPKRQGPFIAPVTQTVVPLPRKPRGDLSDGADYIANPQFDITKVRTYAFAQNPAAMLKGKPGSIQGNVFVLREIQREVRYVLMDQGLSQVALDQAQFLVAIGVGTQSSLWWSPVMPILVQPYGYYYTSWGMGGLAPITYEDGTLLIDFVDPKSGDLLWHGWAVEQIGVNDEQTAIIKSAVGKVLGQL